MESTFSMLGYMRLSVVSPALRVADVDFNRAEIQRTLKKLHASDVQFAVFPELCLTGYTCGDLFYQTLLLEQAEQAVTALAREVGRLAMSAVVGLPVRAGGALYNCAAFLADGRVMGLVPKTYLPNTNEFYEERWFCSSRDCTQSHVQLAGEDVPFGTDLLFHATADERCVIGIEICEDLWSVSPPSLAQVQAGATLVVNPSASPETLGKYAYRRDLVVSQSARCLAAYAYAAAGPGESSTDLVYAGHSLIAENGQLLNETPRFCFDTTFATTDVDLMRLANERLRNNNFSRTVAAHKWRRLEFGWRDPELDNLQRHVDPTPFVPGAQHERSARCQEIFSLQTTALARRLRHTGVAKAVIGISGGLDSTLALLVTVRAFDQLQRDRRSIVALTMPGFGTTGRTRGNAEKLAEMLGVTLRTISIDGAVRRHFEDIGHNEELHDVTYENSQARERTQILMDVANQVGGLVVGTGDLSELALGWCTYNADHMSMYAVNVGVPKTLVRYLVSWCADSQFEENEAAVLHDICDTPVSPELLPPDDQGDIQQKTEETIGPYLLHDFFLFQALRMNYPPDRIYFLAQQAFGEQFGRDQLLRWMKNFYRRFFSQQFKRSCLPDGPKVGSVALSPRGDWRMPSDASVALWLEQVEELERHAGFTAR